MLLEILLILLAAAGLMLVGWCIAGLFLAPFFDESTVCYAYIEGGAPALETKVKAYAWLRGSGFASGKMILVDCGMSADAIKRVSALRKDRPWLDCCKLSDLPEFQRN